MAIERQQDESTHAGSTAIVVGASGGIGAAIADALRARGTSVIGLARSYDGVGHIDLEQPDTIAQAAERVAEQGISPYHLIVATGLLHADGMAPERQLKDVSADALARAFAVNATGPMLVARHFLPLMPRRGPIRVAFLSARVGSISDNALGGWYAYRASKAALNMLVRNLGIEWARKNPDAVIAALHPGTVETGLSAPFRGNVRPGQLVDPATSAANLLAVIDGLTSAQTGRLFDWQGKEIAP